MNRLHYLRLRDSLLRSATATAAAGTDPATPLAYLTALPVGRPWQTSAGVTATTISIDLGGAPQVDTFAVVGHNLTETAVVELHGGSTPAAADFSVSIPWNLRTAWAVFADEQHRYWRLTIDDATNLDEYLQIGLLLMGKSTELSVGYVNDSFEWLDETAVRQVESELSVPHVGRTLSEQARLSLSFEDVDRGAALELSRWLRGLKGRATPLLLIPNPSHPDALFGRYDGRFERLGRGNTGFKWDIRASFLEDPAALSERAAAGSVARPRAMAASVEASTVMTAALAVAFDLEADPAAGSTAVTAALSGRWVVDGLQNLWLFNEGSGQQLTDYVGSADGELGDSSGSDDHDPSWVTEGLEFFGAAGDGDYVVLPNFLNPGATNYTIIIVFASDTDGKMILQQVNGAGTNQIRYRHGGIEDGAAGNWNRTHVGQNLQNDGAVTLGKWYFAAVRWNGSTLTLNLRSSDGNSQQNFGSLSMPNISDGSYQLGRQHQSTASTFEGKMALVGAWNRSLSDAEMTQQFGGAKDYLGPRGISL